MCEGGTCMRDASACVVPFVATLRLGIGAQSPTPVANGSDVEAGSAIRVIVDGRSLPLSAYDWVGIFKEPDGERARRLPKPRAPPVPPLERPPPPKFEPEL